MTDQVLKGVPLMSNSPMNICAAMIVSMLAGMAPTAVGMTNGDDASSATAGTAVAAPGQVRVASKFSAPFVTMAGSQENAVALANALRTGTPATLTYTSLAADGTTTITTVTITPPTRPMGWGNVSHSLALAQFALKQAGITNPTGAQLQAALQGGSVTTANGTTVEFAGVLQQRADGAGWGRIAQSYGTTMGAVNRGIKAPTTTVATPTTVTAPKVHGVAAAPGLTTAAGTMASAGQGSKGLTTAAGTTVSGHGAKGLTTAAGATSRATGHGKTDGIVSAGGGVPGNGNAYGRGVVTAAGSSAGVASGVNASSGAGKGVVSGTGSVGHVVTANPGHGAGSAQGNGKGKGGG
jgi:hypothetical protein